MAVQAVNGPYDFLVNPITSLPLSTRQRSDQEIWAAGRSIGLNQYGTGVEGEVDCVANNILAFPGMIVEITEGFGKIKKDNEGKEYTVPPYKYDGLVLAVQRNWDTFSRTYTICPTSTCSVLVLRLDSEQKCLYFDHKDWITTWVHFRDRSKERVTARITSDVLSAEHIVTMLECGVVGGHTQTLDFRVELGPHICASGDSAARMPAPKDHMLRFTNAMPVLVLDPTLRARKAADVTAVKAAPRKEVASSAKEAVVDTEASGKIKTLRRRPPKPSVSKVRAKKKKPDAKSVEDGPADAWAPVEGGDHEGGAREGDQGEDFSFEEDNRPAISTTSLEDLYKEVVLYLNRYKTWTIGEYLTSMNMDQQERQSVQEQDKVMRDEILPAIKRVLELVSSFEHDEISHEDLLEAHFNLAKGCYNLWVTADSFEEEPRIVKLIPRIGEVLKRLSEDHEVDVVYQPESTEQTSMEAPSDSDVPPVLPVQTVNAAATVLDGNDDAIVALAEAASDALDAADAAAKVDGSAVSGIGKPHAVDPSAPIEAATATAAGITATDAGGAAPRRGGRLRASDSPDKRESEKKAKK